MDIVFPISNEAAEGKEDLTNIVANSNKDNDLPLSENQIDQVVHESPLLTPQILYSNLDNSADLVCSNIDRSLLCPEQDFDKDVLHVINEILPISFSDQVVGEQTQINATLPSVDNHLHVYRQASKYCQHRLNHMFSVVG